MTIGCMVMGGYYKVDNLDIRRLRSADQQAGGGRLSRAGRRRPPSRSNQLIDELARKLGMDPLEFRLQNCVEEGDLRPNGAPWPRIGLKEMLETMQAHPAWQNREARARPARASALRSAVGRAASSPRTANVPASNTDGKITVALGSVDISGTNTTFGADRCRNLRMARSRSDRHRQHRFRPVRGQTGGSKITYTVGAAVQNAAEDAKEQVLAIAGQELEAAIEDLSSSTARCGCRACRARRSRSEQIAVDEHDLRRQIRAGLSATAQRRSRKPRPASPRSWWRSMSIRLTGEDDDPQLFAAQDVGFAINPAMVEGQI